MNKRIKKKIEKRKLNELKSLQGFTPQKLHIAELRGQGTVASKHGTKNKMDGCIISSGPVQKHQGKKTEKRKLEL